jgi:hypothetical protein
MLEALHKKTNLPFSGYKAFSTFQEPHAEEWVCCPIDNKPVTPVRSHERKTGIVVAHFRLINDELGGCSVGESDEHRKYKILISSLVENANTPLIVGQTEIPYSSLKVKSVPMIAARWEKPVENHRADVLFSFIEWHPVLGQGIVFEIQLSSISVFEKEKRENEWIENGYSLSWLQPSDFSEETYSLNNNKIIITNPWALKYLHLMEQKQKDAFYKIQELTSVLSDLRLSAISTYNGMKEEIHEYTIEQLKKDFLYKSCRTCTHGSDDLSKVIERNPGTAQFVQKMKPTGLVACWYNYKNGISKRPSKREPMSHCENWRGQTN